MKTLKILIITVVLGIFISTSVIAYTGKTTTSGVNLRDGASTSSPIIRSIENNEEVDIIGETGNWYKVLYKGREGYVSKDYVKKSSENYSSNENTTTTAPVSENLVKDAKIENTAINTTVNTSNNAVENTDTNITSNELTEGVLINESEVYVLPLISAYKLGSIKAGEKLKVLSRVKNWIFVEKEGIQGWIFERNLSSLISGDTSKMKVKLDGVNLREKPNTSAKIIKVLDKNTEVTILNKVDDWYEVESNGSKGFILGKLLS